MCPFCGTGVYAAQPEEQVSTAVATLPQPAADDDLLEATNGTHGTRRVPTR